MKFIDGVNAAGQPITGAAAAVNPNDVPNFGQVQALFQGVSWKFPVVAVATANVTLSGVQTIDGVALTAGQRVLVTAQTTGSQNGLWTVASGTWTRPADSTGTNLSNGDVVEVMGGGTSYGNSQWRLTTPNPITPDTTTQTWTQVPNGSGQTYTAGAGLTQSGNAFAVNADGTSVIADGTSVRVNPAWSGLPHRYNVTLAANQTTVNHNLGSTDLDVQVQDISGAAPVSTGVTVTFTDANNIALAFPTPPAASQYRVIIKL